jgi:peptidoglycan/LPS O-acetylase OafA/YrhL
MLKQLSMLNGLAIVAAVLNHSVSYGYIAMFWWVDQYRPVTPPNYEQIGSPSYFGLVALQSLTLFCVPAFLFAAGYFVAYAARAESGLTWKMVRARVTRLLVPYLIWSALRFLTDPALQQEFVVPYYFIVVLIQFYLLSPFIVRWAKTYPRRLLISTGVLQIVSNALLVYLQIAADNSSRAVFSHIGWLFIWFAFYFPFGVVAGLYWTPIRAWIARFKWLWVLLAVACGLASILEDLWLRQVTQTPPSWQAATFTSNLYALAFVLAFVSFNLSKIRGSRLLNWLGAHSYGIYLAHYLFIALIARFYRRVTPFLLSQQVLFVVVLAITDIGLVALMMEAVARTPARRAYRYLFG